MIKKFLTEKYTSLVIEILSIFILFFFALVVFSNNNFDFSFYHNGDVHRGFHRGIDLWAGINSYKAFNPENMLTQEKVPGFFPLYFYFMAFIAWLSNFSFIQFIDTLRVIIFTCYLVIGLLIYFYLRRTGVLIAVFGMCVFMFNRWTLFDVVSLKQESYVLLLLLSSLLLIKKNKYLGFLLFGLATAIKHLSILIAPLLIYYVYQDVLKGNFRTFYKKPVFKEYLLSFAIFLAPIVLPSIWYIVDDSERFINAILFNVTREPESEVSGEVAAGLEKALVLYNQDLSNFFLLFLPRFPLLIALVMINIFLFQSKITEWSYATLTYLSFISFNPTLFDQYVVWFFAFVPFILREIIKSKN